MLARLAEGDRTAFDEAFTTLWPIVLAVSVRLLGSEADAEDATQQALTKMFTRINEYDVDRSAFSWTLGIAAWECRALRTKRARRREDVVHAATDVPYDAPSPEDAAMRNEFLAAAAEAIGSLSDGDQAALRAAFDGAPNPIDATHRKRRQRAFDRLRITWRRIVGTI